jgi:hypothetical protein
LRGQPANPFAASGKVLYAAANYQILRFSTGVVTAARTPGAMIPRASCLSFLLGGGAVEPVLLGVPFDGLPVLSVLVVVGSPA